MYGQLILLQQFLCEFTYPCISQHGRGNLDGNRHLNNCCCRHTLHWTPFSQCSLATSRRCAVNNMFIYSSLMSIVCMLKLKVQFCMQREGFEECTQNLTFHVGGAKGSCGFTSAGSSYYKMWVDLNGFQSQKRLSAWRCKDWHRLHESCYCHFKIYAVPVTLILFPTLSAFLVPFS